MKDAALEITGTLFALAAFTVGHLYTEDSLYLFIFMMAGTAAGAVLGVFGGKKYAMFDTGANGIVAKLACHICIVVIFGPTVLDWALKKWQDTPPQAVASMVGGCLALGGTNIIIALAPVAALFLKYLVCKIPGMAQFQQEQTPGLPPPPVTLPVDPRTETSSQHPPSP